MFTFIHLSPEILTQGKHRAIYQTRIMPYDILVTYPGILPYMAHTRMHRQTWYRFSALCPKQGIFNNCSLKSR